jgi:CRISPR-associated endoribonuclease Cas6
MNKVFQLRVKIYIMIDIELENAQEEVCAFIDKAIISNPEFIELHNENRYKGYCFDLPYKIENDKIYKRDNIYGVTVRTVDPKLAKFFEQTLPNTTTNAIKGLIVSEVKIIPKKLIQTIYTLTPAIVKSDQGYWRSHMSIQQYEELLVANLIKKYNYFNQTKIDENFEFITQLEFMNKKPVATIYKNHKLLGDKLQIHVAENEMAQQLAYFAIGTGLQSHNSRGAGYVNYRWY